MKKLALATILSLTAAGGAFAQSLESPAELNSHYRSLVLQYVPDADLSTLTVEQKLVIQSFLSDSDNRSSGSNPAGYIQNVLRG